MGGLRLLSYTMIMQGFCLLSLFFSSALGFESLSTSRFSRNLPILGSSLETYKNRSILLENTLQHKLQALELSEQKLRVLQDAMKRLVKRQEKDSVDWREKYHSSERSRLQAVNELGDYQRNYQSLQRNALEERDELLADLKELQKMNRKNQKRWKEEVDVSARLEIELRDVREEHKLEIKELNDQGLRIQTDLRETVASQASALEKLERGLESEKKRSNSWKTKYSDQVEQIEIAEASVNASKARERDLKEQYDGIQAQYEGILDETKRIQVKLFQAEERADLLEASFRKPSRNRLWRRVSKFLSLMRSNRESRT